MLNSMIKFLKKLYMAEKYKNKYRIESARLQSWDYRWSGAYFITICTHNREHFFGKIINGKMILSNIGILANIFWFEIKNHSHNIQLGEFIVMPNHMHGILVLDNGEILNDPQIINENNTNSVVMVETTHALSLQKSIGQNRFQNQGKNSISSIVGGYKSAVTKHANRLGFEFAWQTRFYDHIIRDENSFNNISNYIINNPKNWEKDKFIIGKNE